MPAVDQVCEVCVLTEKPCSFGSESLRVVDGGGGGGGGGGEGSGGCVGVGRDG